MAPECGKSKERPCGASCGEGERLLHVSAGSVDTVARAWSATGGQAEMPRASRNPCATFASLRLTYC